MKKQLIRSAAAGMALALAVSASALAKREVARVGDLYLVDNGGITPTKLPRHTQAPISAHILAEIGTTDGSHPPAIQTVAVDFDRTIQIDARGLPACRRGQLEARSTTAAKQACPEAIIGSGEGEVEVAFPEQAPFRAKGPIFLFNGGTHGGKTIVFIHAYVPVPAPTAIVAITQLSPIHRGFFGTHSFTQVPVIAGGSGSVTKFKITIGRAFAYRGEKQSYLTASCPTGHYFTEGEVLFRDGTKLGLKHVLPCTPAG
jgi:hypothetical protein